MRVVYADTARKNPHERLKAMRIVGMRDFDSQCVEASIRKHDTKDRCQDCSHTINSWSVKNDEKVGESDVGVAVKTSLSNPFDDLS